MTQKRTVGKPHRRRGGVDIENALSIVKDDPCHTTHTCSFVPHVTRAWGFIDKGHGMDEPSHGLCDVCKTRAGASDCSALDFVEDRAVLGDADLLDAGGGVGAKARVSFCLGRVERLALAYVTLAGADGCVHAVFLDEQRDV